MALANSGFGITRVSTLKTLSCLIHLTVYRRELKTGRGYNREMDKERLEPTTMVNKAKEHILENEVYVYQAAN